jgi:hypothetical protein
VERYDRWNNAIAEVMFPGLKSPEPVYLHFEDEVLDLLASRMKVAPDEMSESLCGAVRETLDVGGPSIIFRQHVVRTLRWVGVEDWRRRRFLLCSQSFASPPRRWQQGSPLECAGTGPCTSGCPAL